MEILEYTLNKTKEKDASWAFLHWEGWNLPQVAGRKNGVVPTLELPFRVMRDIGNKGKLHGRARKRTNNNCCDAKTFLKVPRM